MGAKTLIGLALIAIASCVTAGGVYGVLSLKRGKLDAATLCPAEGSKTGVFMIIDKTDPLTDVEQRRIKGLVTAKRERAGRGDRLLIALLKQKDGSPETALETVADLCNPGADGNPLYENARRVAFQYQNDFIQPLDAALASLPDARPAPFSPIAAAMSAMVDRLPDGAVGAIDLILISDLMEHTPEASAYSGSLTAAALGNAVSPKARKRLMGSSITVMLLKRPAYRAQQAAAIEIWKGFLAAMSGSGARFD